MPKRIIQYSPVRSGSTLLYNILKMLYVDSGYEVYKAHHLEEPDKNNIVHIMSTFRHPYDCVISLTQINTTNPTFEDYKKNISVYLKNGGNNMFDNFQKILTHDKIVWFKYEDFVNDFGHIFDKIERGTNIVIAEERRKEIEDKLNIERVNKYIQRFKDFTEYDRNNHFHGKHISKDKGAINRYRKYLTEDQIKQIRDIFMKKSKNFMTFMKHNSYEISK